MIVLPNAKINLGLHIIEKRKDSFHNIESILYPIELKDVLEVIVSKETKTSMEISGIKVPGDVKTNLCIKAYHLLAKDYNLPPVKIYLHKIIPVGAGLGGGSADAAYTIKTFNEIFSLHLSNKKMENYASELGSDCTFFIYNKPALATQKGEVLEELSIDLSSYYIVIVYPNFPISTQEAYAQVTPKKRDATLKEIVKQPIKEWKYSLFNDFESPLFLTYPILKEIKEKMYTLGALYASMSGSGSTMYGIFDHFPDLKQQFSNYFVWKGKLITDLQ